MMTALIISLAACSWLKRGSNEEDIAVDDQSPRAAAPPSVQINYAKPNDTLQTVIVSQFTGASVLRTMGEGDAQESLIRFDGGVPIWKFHANRNLLNPLNDIGKSPFHIASVQYGTVPKGFIQDAPEAGPPPPLSPGTFYIFEIERASGAISYQAARVKSDFTIEAYDAEPRAGTSYKLCCNVSSDFPAATPSLEEPPAIPDATSSDDQQ